MTTARTTTTSPETDRQQPLRAQVHTDGTGGVSVLASPQWWRSVATADNWPELAESIARAGEQDVRRGLCGVVGATTGRPCKVYTRLEPCPHHGAGHEKNRCGAKTRKGPTCQWNLVVNGACRNHPDTWERIKQERLTQEEAEQRARAEAAQAQAEEREREEAETLTVPCSDCRAEAGETCKQPNGLAAGGSHAPRHRYRKHLTAAEIASCTSCGAAIGSLCRTGSDTEAAEPHSARRRAVTVCRERCPGGWARLPVRDPAVPVPRTGDRRASFSARRPRLTESGRPSLSSCTTVKSGPSERSAASGSVPAKPTSTSRAHFRPDFPARRGRPGPAGRRRSLRGVRPDR
ncbi:zinc finger domain-containing protein [Kitasatospora griseola]